MDPLLVLVSLAAVFAGTHVGLATTPIRARLVARLGEAGFRALFFVVAASSFTALVVYYADHRTLSGAGPALGAVPVLGLVLRAAVVGGFALMLGSLAAYPGSPYDLNTARPARAPRGLEQVTRHPFFAGLTVFAAAHALLAPTRMGSVLMAALAALSIVGARHQDSKLLRLRGPTFAEWLARTSAMPFAAILAGRARLVWHELPGGALAAGALLAVLLRQVHGEIFAHHGAWVVLAVVGGALTIGVAGAFRVHHERTTRAARRVGTMSPETRG